MGQLTSTQPDLAAGTSAAADETSTPDRRQAALDEIAQAVCRRGLGTCAIFALESVKPLNFIGSQALHALGPMASLLFDARKWESLAEALEERDTIERLIRKIEDRERGSSPKS